MRKSTTPKGVASSLTSLPRVGCVTLANPALSKVQPRWGMGTPCGLMEMGRGGLHMDGWFHLGELRVNGILFVWDAWKKMMEMGRGGACVPARVAPQGRIHRSSPVHNACVFGMETPLCGRSGGHTGTAPTILFEWMIRECRRSFTWGHLICNAMGNGTPCGD